MTKYFFSFSSESESGVNQELAPEVGEEPRGHRRSGSDFEEVI